MTESDGSSDSSGAEGDTPSSDMGYTPNEVAQEVSAENDYHDAYENHVVEKDEFSAGPYGEDLNINSREDYEILVSETIVHEETYAFEDSGGHHHYYKEDINLFGFVSPERDYNHTWFRPDNGIDYYHQQYDKHVDDADGINRDRIVQGGYSALEEWKENQTEQIQEDTHNKEELSEEDLRYIELGEDKLSAKENEAERGDIDR